MYTGTYIPDQEGLVDTEQAWPCTHYIYIYEQRGQVDTELVWPCILAPIVYIPEQERSCAQ